MGDWARSAVEREGAVSQLSKTASAALAALVVSGAAAVVPLLGPAPAADRGDQAGAGSVRPVASSPATPSAGRASTPADVASGLSARLETPAVRRAALFLGDVPALHPSGGASRSFACRAAAGLGWTCAVRSRPVGRARYPASLRADVVVVVLSTQDDARTVATTLDALPAALSGARTVLLAPVAVSLTTAQAARLAAVRVLAVQRGAEVVDPVASHWITAQNRRTYVSGDGALPTAAGIPYLAQLLANALR